MHAKELISNFQSEAAQFMSWNQSSAATKTEAA